MFDLILNPIVTLLVFFYDLMGNQIVISIALVTTAIRVITSPLIISQQRSQAKMALLQPELNKLKEKYKNDREKMSQAQMQLFKEQGINPLGGCLPLLIQLPIMFALYRAINLSLASTPYELIDLSDRLLVSSFDAAIPLRNIWLGMDLTLPPTANPMIALSLPVLVMVTTWLQSKLTMPSAPAGDDKEPNQAAQMTKSMTTMMPLMFGFFSLSFSVGLSIYFFVSNVVGILQYTLMGKAEWGKLLGMGDRKAEAAMAKNNGKTEITAIKAAPSDAVGKDTAPGEGSVPKRPSGRKDKKMKRVSRQEK